MPQKIPISGPDCLGRYQIASVLGQGAMGKVYKAFDPVIERTVAVKTINLRFEAHEVEQFKERFYREAKAAGGLNHPNIVTIYDVAEEDDTAYIAMELLDGLSLRQILDAGSCPPSCRVARIIAEVAEALAYAHDRGVIHRDVKPANIILTRSGLTKITDFGIAQLPATSSTQPGLLIGSPRYMAPEQIISSPIDGRVDIFAIGAVLYEMLTGQAAFQGKDMGELMYQILHHSPVPPSRFVPGSPTGLDAIVEQAMAKNPDDRFQNARELARALRNFQPIPASEETFARRSDRLSPPADRLIETDNAELNSEGWPEVRAQRFGRHRKSVAFVAMGLAAGGVFASVAFNQFTPPPIEKLPSRMQTAVVNITNFMPPIFAGVAPAQIRETQEAQREQTEPPAVMFAQIDPPRPAPLPRVVRLAPRAQPTAPNEMMARLKTLQHELMDLKSRFTDLHPDVLAKKRHIDRLEEEKRERERYSF